MARRTWNAAGRLRDVWEKMPRTDGKEGRGRAEDLAVATRRVDPAGKGIPREMLSAYNSGGRPLGPHHAGLISKTAGVTLADLGKPPSEETDAERLDRLERQVADLRARVVSATEILEALEILKPLTDAPASEQTPLPQPEAH